jgi:hypothetical protein
MNSFKNPPIPLCQRGSYKVSGYLSFEKGGIY